MNLVTVVFYSDFFPLLIALLSYFLIMLHFSKKPETINRKQIFPSVSLLIATFNEEAIISRKLRNTLELTYPRDKFEVLIVDSGSTDNTRNIVNAFANKYANHTKIQLLTQEERLGKSAAINYAVKLAKSDIIVLSDADVIVNKEAMLRLVSNFNDERIGAVSGIEVMQNPDETSTTKLERGYRSFYNTLRMGEGQMDSVVMCESEFAGYRRELIEEIPKKSICDDMELTLQIRKKGFRAIYDPALIFYEFSPSKYFSRISHKVRRGQGNQQTLLRSANMLFRPKYGLFSSVILPYEFFMNVISPILSVICAASFLIMTFFYFNVVSIFFPLFVVMVASLFVFVPLKISSPATDITLSKSKSGSGFHLIESITDLVLMEFLLLISLISLVLLGPNYKWKAIDGTRRSCS